MMADFASPVRRGNFIYHPILYAEVPMVGNGHRHPRASVSELAALLRPDGPTSAKDQVWHYYSAQLIHYDLQSTKDKNAAKVRLLNALNNFKLEVPAWILKLEGELRKEWEGEMRRLKRSVGATAKQGKVAKKEGGRGSESVGATASSSSGVNVTVNLSLSGTPLSSLISNSPDTVKKTQTAKRKRTDNDSGSVAGTPKKAPRTATAPAPPKTPLKKEKTPIKAEKTPIKKDKTSSPALPRNKSSPRPRTKNSHPTSPHTSSPHTKHEYTPRIPSDPILSGTYSTTCPTATSLFGPEDFGPDDFSMTIARDPARGVWWATFR